MSSPADQLAENVGGFGELPAQEEGLTEIEQGSVAPGAGGDRRGQESPRLVRPAQAPVEFPGRHPDQPIHPWVVGGPPPSYTVDPEGPFLVAHTAEQPREQDQAVDRLPV